MDFFTCQSRPSILNCQDILMLCRHIRVLTCCAGAMGLLGFLVISFCFLQLLKRLLSNHAMGLCDGDVCRLVIRVILRICDIFIPRKSKCVAIYVIAFNNTKNNVIKNITTY